MPPAMSKSALAPVTAGAYAPKGPRRSEEHHTDPSLLTSLPVMDKVTQNRAFLLKSADRGAREEATS